MSKRARAPKRGSRSGEAPARSDGYPVWSMDPLHILIFLLPLVVLYELVLLFSGHTGVVETVAAHALINRFGQVLGDFALYLPGVVLIGTLLAMKFARRDEWTVRVPVLLLMCLESVVWAIPLLVIAALLSTEPAVAVSPGTDPAELSLLGRIALSIGAGLYEELLFRLLMVGLGAWLLRTIFRMSATWAAGLAIVLAAVAFTFYHHPGETGSVAARRLVYFVAGCFLGLVFVLRGFGIVVGAHAVYDLFVLVVLTPGDDD